MRRMFLITVLLTGLVVALLPITTGVGGQQPAYGANENRILPAPHVPAPEEILGFVPGDDRKLASWNQVVDYFRRLSEASDRVRFEELGKSTMGAPFVLVTISAADNLANLGRYRRIQDLLADPRKLGANPDKQAQALIARGKTIVLITCGIHSTEVGSYLSSMLIAHRLASSNEPAIQSVLKNCIVLLVPSLNPDGVDIVKNWYDKTIGTSYEGTEPPQLYHKYTGHDNNRDWYAFTQVETRIAVEKIHNVWHPQIVHDIHQQGAYGSRIFLPPYMQPVEPNVPKEIVEGYKELGRYMAHEMRAAGFKGITTDSTYDAWSPSRAYSHYHGGVRILSETASCKLATPITINFNQLQPREGYDPQKETPNFGPLWRGGEWHLRDITTYMVTAAFHLLKHASAMRQQWLQRFYQIGKEAVRRRNGGELFAFIIPPATHRTDLLETLDRAEVEVDYSLPFTAVGTRYAKDTAIIKSAQPYGAFARALLQEQRYPDLRDKSGHPIPPYDVTAHTLSLLMGVSVNPVYQPVHYRISKERAHDGSELRPVESKVGVYHSHVPSMDEGWTRWVLEQQHMNYSSVDDADVRSGGLYLKYRSILLPDQPGRSILEGLRRGTFPPEYTGGMGESGVNALREFVTDGGTLVCLNRASDFAIEQLKLPLRDAVAGLSRSDFYVPGSILRIEVDTSKALAAGMPRESIAWVEDSPAFEPTERKELLAGSRVGAGADEGRVDVVARYPRESSALLSGWLLGGEHIKGKAALVEVTMGKGHVVLFGFRPQYRGQSLATYPLLFNAISANRGPAQSP